MVHLMLPVVSGTSIGLDNTCKSVLSLQEFFGISTKNYNQTIALNELQTYRKCLETDIRILEDGSPIKQKKQERLEQVKYYIQALKSLKNSRQLDVLHGEFPGYPKALKDLMKSNERRNIYSVHLKPREQDNSLRSVSPVFKIVRDNDDKGMPKSKLYNAMHDWFRNLQIKPQQDLRSTITQNVIQKRTASSEQTIQELLHAECESLLGISIDFTKTTAAEKINDEFINNELNNCVLFIKEARPDNLEMYKGHFLFIEPDKLSYIHYDGREDVISLADTDFVEKLTAKRTEAFKQKNASLPPRLKLQYSSQIKNIPLTKNSINSLITQTTGYALPPSTNKDIIDILIGYCAPNAFDNIIESPFAKIDETYNRDAVEKLSIITQFFLAEINIYCVANNLTSANFGGIFDTSDDLSHALATLVAETLTANASVEQAILNFINSNQNELHLSDQLTSNQMQEIKQRFAEDFMQIRQSPHFDEFMLLDNQHPGLFFTHQGAITVDFAELANAPELNINSEFFESIRAESRSWQAVNLSHKSNHNSESVRASLELLPEVFPRLPPDKQRLLVDSIDNEDIIQTNSSILFILLAKLNAERQAIIIDKIPDDKYNEIESRDIFLILESLPPENQVAVIAKIPKALFNQISAFTFIEELGKLSPEAQIELIANVPKEIFSKVRRSQFILDLGKLSLEAQSLVLPLIPEQIFSNVSEIELISKLSNLSPAVQSTVIEKIPLKVFSKASCWNLVADLTKLDPSCQAMAIEKISDTALDEIYFRELIKNLSALSQDAQKAIIPRIHKDIFAELGALQIINYVKHLEPECQLIVLKQISYKEFDRVTNPLLIKFLSEISPESQHKVMMSISKRIFTINNHINLLDLIRDLNPQVKLDLVINYLKNSNLEQAPRDGPNKLCTILYDLTAHELQQLISKTPKAKLNAVNFDALTYLQKCATEMHDLIIDKLPKETFRSPCRLEDLCALSPNNQKKVLKILSTIPPIQITSQNLLEALSKLSSASQLSLINNLSTADFSNVTSDDVRNYLHKLAPNVRSTVIKQLNAANNTEQELAIKETLPFTNFLDLITKGEERAAKQSLAQSSSPGLNKQLITEKVKIQDPSGRIFFCTAYEYAYWAGDFSMYHMLANYIQEHLPNHRQTMDANIRTIETQGLTYELHDKTQTSAHYAVYFPLHELKPEEFQKLQATLGIESETVHAATADNYRHLTFTYSEFTQLKKLISTKKPSQMITLFARSPLQAIDEKITIDSPPLLAVLENFVASYTSLSNKQKQQACEIIEKARTEAPAIVASCMPPIKHTLDLDMAEQYLATLKDLIEKQTNEIEEIYNKSNPSPDSAGLSAPD